MEHQTSVTIDFDKLGGIIPVVVQDTEDLEVLMLGFMNEDAWRRTIETGMMWYFSRKRQALWRKGEQSGHIQKVKRLYLDCDNDSLLAQVEQVGGACDLGFRSCFEKEWSAGDFHSVKQRVFDPSKAYPAYSEQLRIAVPTGSLQKTTKDLLALAFPEGASSEASFHAVLESYGSPVTFIEQNPREIARLVASGACDAGITGLDLVLEAGLRIVPLANLGYNKRGRGPAVWAVAVPDSHEATRLSDLEGCTLVSELREVALRFFQRRGVGVDVVHRTGDHQEFFSGKPVVELIETGETLRKFGYRPLAPVLTSHAVMIASPESYGYTWKRRRMEQLAEGLVQASEMLRVSDRAIYQFEIDLTSMSDPMVDWHAFRAAWFACHGEVGYP